MLYLVLPALMARSIQSVISAKQPITPVPGTGLAQGQSTEALSKLEALAVNNGRPHFLVFRLGHPHLLER